MKLIEKIMDSILPPKLKIKEIEKLMDLILPTKLKIKSHIFPNIFQIKMKFLDGKNEILFNVKLAIMMWPQPFFFFPFYW